MENGIAVKIEYWIYPSDRDFKGADEFRKTLSENYVSSIHARPGSAGGNFQLAIEFISNITLVDVVRFLLSGIAYDMIKAGAQAFVLRPFLAAYQKLRDQNREVGIGIEQLRIVFQDTILTIDQIRNADLIAELGKILAAIAAHSEQLNLKAGIRPYEIYVPVFKDPKENPPCQFRAILDVDETIRNISSVSYYEFWGLDYGLAREYRVYDVKQKILIDEQFCRRDRYWKEMEFRWSQKNL